MTADRRWQSGADRHDGQLADQWSARHFSVSNPRGASETDLPLLLRRLADAIEAHAIQPMDILDLTVSGEITENGPWWSATVYWSPEAAPA